MDDLGWIITSLLAAAAVWNAWKANRNAVGAGKHVKTLHLEVNSRLTELLEAARAAANSAGHARGVEEERQRKEGGEKP